MGRSSRIAFLSAAALLVAALSPSLGEAAPAEESRGEVGGLVGGQWPDDDLTDSETTPDFDLMLGAFASWAYNDTIAWFADGTFGSHSSDVIDDFDLLTVRAGLELRFARDDDGSHWLLTLAPGWMDVSPDGADDFDRSLLSAGFGRRYLTRWGSLRWEARVDSSLGDSGLDGERITNVAAVAGAAWGFGGKRVDSDGDGVVDRRDRCAGTPAGAEIDLTGCPTDSDGDGVFDGLDLCVQTDEGWPVDADGCPTDSDDDGVFDGVDACPGTAAAALVDPNGCPIDTDADGVADGIDRCGNTPNGASVGADGCPLDGDGDGVFDGIDACPDSPAGANVDEKGCTVDSDGDGVVDGVDQCPNTRPGSQVDAAGCPEGLLEDIGVKLVLEPVNFTSGSADLSSDAMRSLDLAAESLRVLTEVTIEIAGYTDVGSSETSKLRISLRRAEAVREYLAGKGIALSRLIVRAYGDRDPIASNATEEGRAKNRRVELKRLE